MVFPAEVLKPPIYLLWMSRVAASAPAGYITSFRRLMESVGVQDGEQNFYHGISSGIDHADFIRDPCTETNSHNGHYIRFLQYSGIARNILRSKTDI